MERSLFQVSGWSAMALTDCSAVTMSPASPVDRTVSVFYVCSFSNWTSAATMYILVITVASPEPQPSEEQVRRIGTKNYYNL